MEMISPGYPLTLKTGNTLTKQEEAQTLDACNRLQALLSVKASVKQIEQASFLLSSMKSLRTQIPRPLSFPIA